MRIFKRSRVSSTGLRLAAVVGLAAVLGACHGTDLEGVRDLEPQGSEFNQQLFAGYVGLSARELAEHDYRDSDGFAAKAAAAARGDDVRPTAVGERLIAVDKQEELSNARGRLMQALFGSAKGKAPAIAASAQISYECWLQEQEEGHQPGDIADCRNAFYGQVIAAEVAIRPPPPPPEPEPEPEPVYVTYYVVFFDFDSSELSTAAMQTLDEASETALAMRPYKIVIRGHTDRAGPDAYNLGLSERRALSVAGYMIEQGAGRFVIDAEGLGESEPIAKTADNVRDGRNRRVEVTLSE
ncbi:MAG: OmpA family protein [Rhodospirillales bacterium]|nr:OmpA family protein [Rhodospirillales bacterium]